MFQMTLRETWCPVGRYFGSSAGKAFLSLRLRRDSDKVRQIIIWVTTLNSLTLLGLGGILGNTILVGIAGLTFLLLPRGVCRLLQIRMEVDAQQFDLDVLFVVASLTAISETSRAASQAFYLLDRSPNPYLRLISRQALVGKSTLSPVGVDALLELLDHLWDRPSVQLLRGLFERWNAQQSNSSFPQRVLMGQVETELQQDLKNFETLTAYINSIFGVVPLGILMVLLLGGGQVHPLLELSLVGLVLVATMLYILDLYRIAPLTRVVGSLAQTQSSSISTTLIRPLVQALLHQPNYPLALNATLWEMVSPEQQIQRKTLTKVLTGHSISVTKLVNEFRQVLGGIGATLVEVAADLCEVDTDVGVRQLLHLEEAVVQLEHHYLRKKGLLNGEKRKTVLLAGLLSFSMGILAVISPLFFQLSQGLGTGQEASFTRDFLAFNVSLGLVTEVWAILGTLTLIYGAVFQEKRPNHLFQIFALWSFLYLMGLCLSGSLVRPLFLL